MATDLTTFEKHVIHRCRDIAINLVFHDSFISHDKSSSRSDLFFPPLPTHRSEFASCQSSLMRRHQADELLMMFVDGCRAWEMSLMQNGCGLLKFIYLIRLMYFEVTSPRSTALMRQTTQQHHRAGPSSIQNHACVQPV